MYTLFSIAKFPFPYENPRVGWGIYNSYLLNDDDLYISETETPFGKRILIKKRKIREQMKIILLAQYFEIFQISSSGKIFTKPSWN